MKTSKYPKVKRAEIVVAAIALGSFSPSVFAYLDPSTGSMILSAIVGIFATLGLAVKTYWYKLKSLFRGSESSASNPSADNSAAASAADNEGGSAS